MRSFKSKRSKTISNNFCKMRQLSIRSWIWIRIQNFLETPIQILIPYITNTIQSYNLIGTEGLVSRDPHSSTGLEGRIFWVAIFVTWMSIEHFLCYCFLETQCTLLYAHCSVLYRGAMRFSCEKARCLFKVLRLMLLHNVEQHNVNVTWCNVTKRSCTQRKSSKT